MTAENPNQVAATPQQPSVWNYRDLVRRSIGEAYQCTEVYAQLYGRPMITPAAQVLQQLGDTAEHAVDQWEAAEERWERAQRDLLDRIEYLTQQATVLSRAAHVETVAAITGLQAEVAQLQTAVRRYAKSNTTAQRAIKEAERARIAAALGAADAQQDETAA